MTMPITVCGAPAAATPRSSVGESTLARPTTATSETSSSAKLAQAAGGAAAAHAPIRRRVPRRQEVVAVADGLHEDEDAPERERGDAGEGELRRRCRRARRAGREARQHERQRRQRDQRGERRGRALEAERLLVVAEAADQQAQADHAVADDHDRREDRVARQRRLVGAAGEHHRDDQRDLDHRDREARISVPNGSPTRCATTSAWCTAASTAPMSAGMRECRRGHSAHGQDQCNDDDRERNQRAAAMVQRS